MIRKPLCFLLPVLLGAAVASASEPVLDEMSLEELVKLDVSTVARKAQKLSDTPAAVTVLSAEDIRRSGARSVPEALREVPGVNVAQIGASRWAVSVRGFNGRFSNKLLVQVDGRSIYSPLFSGVFWEATDVMLEDVERIEVIRGPGASLWGANAVNGIINIVTRKAAATQGSLVAASVDDGGRPVLAARQGITLDDGSAFRIFVKGAEAAPFRSDDGHARMDQARGTQAGFRMDSPMAGSDGWMVQGNAYRRTSSEALMTLPVFGSNGRIPLNLQFDGANLLGRYSWGLAGGEARLQTYIDRQRVEVIDGGLGTVNTFDVDLQHRLAPVGAHELMWGLGYRYVQTEILSRAPILWMTPPDRDTRVASAFLQDEITLLPQQLRLTLGGRFEYSSLSAFEPQPSVRLMWTPSQADSVWTSWSRAARTPSIGEADANIMFAFQPTPAGTPFPAVALTSQSAPGWAHRAERVDALELGYRRNLGNGSFEVVAFHHNYRRLIGEGMDTSGLVFPGVPLGTMGYAPIQRTYRGNLFGARSTGLELGLDMPITNGLRMQTSYTVMNTLAERSADPATDAYGQDLEASSPHHWASVHALLNLGSGQELDLMVRRVGSVARGAVPAYTAVDLRYGWKLGRSFEFALVGQNLFDPLHLEYVSDLFPSEAAYVPRRGYVQGVWRF